ncbi:HigA family addiction module antitoxin [Schlesneria sp.]|uniref:HigA family addiction module antitoxin n=1 Tax=Schlesneria sp. TaxID=2762018 RepID=UPI002F006380
MTKVVSIEVVLPGEVIQEELDARGWTHEDLADVMGRSRQHVRNLVTGKAAISPESARELSEAFETSAELWMNLQMSYELSKQATKDSQIKKRAALYERVPVREMKKRAWITDDKDVDELESSVLKFMGISSWSQDPQVSMAARKSTEYGMHTLAQKAWGRRVLQLGACVGASKFAVENIPDGVTELRSLVPNPENIRKVPAVLSSMGIRLVLVQHLTGTKIDGAAMWLDECSPVIGLSLRYGRIDNFWHNLFHELVHVREREGMEGGVIDTEMNDGVLSAVSESEARANRDAANYLVPTEKLDSFIARHKKLFYQAKVIQFANSRGVHPGIVVGQLRHRGELDYRQLTKLTVDIRNHILGAALTDGWGDCPLVS